MKTPRDLLIVSSVWPEPRSSAAGQRMMQLIKLFRSHHFQITYASTASGSEYAVDLSRFDIEPVSVKVNSSSFDRFLGKLNPAMVLFDRFLIEEQFGWRVAGQCPNAMRILDTEDLHCLRRARREAVEQGRTFAANDLLGKDDAKREIASILRCDLSLIISEYEMELLRNVFKIDDALLYYLPFLLEPIDEKEADRQPAFEDRTHFMTIGNFRHPPNWDSVQWLREEIWPLIKNELPEAELHIYGAYPSQKVWQLHQAEMGFHIKGRAENSALVMRNARLCLAPLRFGAGLKGKLVEAMQCGTPSVTTAIGAEGIAGRMDWPGRVGKNPHELAKAAIELYTDRQQWEQTQQQGFRIINRRFNRAKFAAPIETAIMEIRNELEQHRTQNFTGAMLMHHTAASTKYMARWIEEKNRTE